MQAMALVTVAVCACQLAAAPGPGIPPRVQANAGRLIERALADGLAWQLAESLVTEVGPRLAGSEAEARARNWALGVLEERGFANVRVEPFGVRPWTRGRERAAITAPYPQPLAVTALGNSIATPAGGVEGEVLRYASIAELQRAPREDLAGRILFVDVPVVRTRDGSGYLEGVAVRTQAAYEAGRRGALAALIRSVGTNPHRLPHTGGMRYARNAPQVPVAALSHPDADQLARALARAPVRVRLELETRGGGQTGNSWEGTPEQLVASGNVIAEIKGHREDIVLAGAHLDSWDLGTGAVDNAAGVAIVIAAASLIERLPGRPRRTLRVVLFGAEETGAAGAAAYARVHAATLARHVLAIEADFGARPVWRFDTRWPQEAQADAADIARVLAPLGIEYGGNTALGGPDLQFLRPAGVPIAALVQEGGDYYDLQHTADDTLDKIVPGELARAVAAYAVLLYLVADTELGFR